MTGELALKLMYQHHRRLFTIDLQTHHDAQELLYRFGEWIDRKLLNLQKRKDSSNQELESCGVSMDILREQWKKQVSKQTETIPRQYFLSQGTQSDITSGQQRNSIQKLVGSLLLLRSQIKTAKNQLQRFKRENMDEEILEEVQSEVNELESKIQRLESQLGEGSRHKTLAAAERDEFLKSRLKAQEIKRILVPRLIARKFESSRLAHGSHRSVFGKIKPFQGLLLTFPFLTGNKMFMQVKKSISNREQGLKQLAQSYNREVTVMTELKENDLRYRNTIVPKLLDLNNLFRLDIFSTIWDDFGLEEGDENEAQLWEFDENVRQGVRAMLELDRSKEEEERLWWEVSSLGRWGLLETHILADSWINRGEFAYLFPKVAIES